MGGLTALEKAEAVLAAFRGEKECQECHAYRADVTYFVWSSSNQSFRNICHSCHQKIFPSPQ